LSKRKYLDVVFKEIDDLILNQNSAIDGVRFQTFFEDRFPYDEFRIGALPDKQCARLRNMFCDRKPFA